jgi:hypothetical protein
VVEEKQNFRSKNTSILLLMFLCGALLSFRYDTYVKAFFGKNDLILPTAFLAALLVATLQLTSLTAASVIPVMSICSGCCTAAAILKIKLALSLGSIPYATLAVTAFFVPISFVVFGIGMQQSQQIKSMVCMKKAVYKKYLIVSYSIMFSVVALIAVLVNYIINK